MKQTEEGQPHFTYLCKRCGSHDVGRDAWAEWDVETQNWVLRCAFDHAHCFNCDTETRLTQVQVGA